MMLAKVLVFIGAFRTFPVVGIIGVIAAMLTAVYVLRLVARSFFGPADEHWAELKDADPREHFVGGLLAGILVLVGVFPRPFLDVINSSVNPLVERILGAL